MPFSRDTHLLNNFCLNSTSWNEQVLVPENEKGHVYIEPLKH